jgi:pimeloyl-ACP methyl ester carboxylesterase
MSKVANVLFVHGAWANSSAWAKVLPLVERAGVNATAVQLPLTSLADDAAAVKRAIELVDGKVVLVGHSYGGAVISEAGNEPQVSGLVYVAGFAPAAGESAGSLGAGGPVTRLPETLRSDAHGFLKLSREGVDEAFAQDLSDDERAIVFATQGPVSGNALGGTVTSPAWEHKPAWYLIAMWQCFPNRKRSQNSSCARSAESLPRRSGGVFPNAIVWHSEIVHSVPAD